MAQYIVRRVLLSFITLLGIIAIVFVIARLLPGDPCLSALGERATEAICNAFNERYGLNEPIHIQFLLYIGQLLRGDLGDSIRYGRPVTEILIERLPTTIELAFYSLIFASVLGVLLGLLSALRRNSKTDVGTMFVAILGVSVPIFVLGLLLQFVFAVALPSVTEGLLGVRVGCRHPGASRLAWRSRPSRRPSAWRTCRACRAPRWTSCPASTRSASW